jgi:fucose permease
MNSQNAQTKWGQFIPLVTVFFFWGFVAASNDILIPVFKKAFDLTQGQSQLVSLAFYIAYTVGSLIYMGISLLMKEDLVNKIGYKNGLGLNQFEFTLEGKKLNLSNTLSWTKEHIQSRTDSMVNKIMELFKM